MKQALQAILIAPNPAVRLAIMLGKKKITIREGHRDYKTGPVMICCHVEPWAVLTTIVDVRYTTLAEITQEELEADGYTDHENMLNDLKSHYYSNLTMDSPMTVIRWGDLDEKSYFADIAKVETYAKDNHLVYML